MAGRRELKRRTESERARRQIIRKASLYAIGFGFAGVIVAIAGGALIAFLLTFSGLPFLRTWITLTAIVIVAGGALALWKK